MISVLLVTEDIGFATAAEALSRADLTVTMHGPKVEPSVAGSRNAGRKSIFISGRRSVFAIVIGG